MLELDEGAWIGHLTVCKGADRLSLGREARLGSLNWITGHSTETAEDMFPNEPDRRSELVLEDGASMTMRHLVDCSNAVRIGRFSTLGGYRTQIVTHFIDVERSQQRCKPVVIGEYCYVGTACVVLGGAVLPDRSVLGANSLLGKPLEDSYRLYGGSPAKELKRFDEDAEFFRRSEPRVT